MPLTPSQPGSAALRFVALPAVARGIVLYLHGGGFLRGTPDDGVPERLAERLTPAGWGVVAAAYRLGATTADLAPAEAAAVAAEAMRGRRLGLRLAPRLTGPAFAAALADAAAAVADLRAGRIRPATAGLPVAVVGVSAGGILAMSLRWPPARYRDGWMPPVLAVAIAGAMIQPWRLEPGGPPAILFHGARDPIVPLSTARLAARRAQACGASLQVVDTGVGGHRAQVDVVLDGRDAAGRPWFDRVLDGLSGQ
jgi:acetyl esterase/lipase